MSIAANEESHSDFRARRKIRLGDLLVQYRVISEKQLEKALNEQKKTGHKLGNTLVELGFIEEKNLLDFLSRQLQVPLLDLKSYKINPDTVRILPESIARRFRALVLEVRENDVLVAMADPTDLFAYDKVAHVLKKRIRQAIVRESDLLRVMDSMYRRTEELNNLAGELDDELAQGDVDLGLMLQTGEASDAPVFRLLQTLFEDAMQANASDIHIEPDETVLRIRQRIDGRLQEQVMNEKRIASAVVQRLKLLAGLDISEKRLPQDGRFQIKVKGRSVDVRLSTMPVQYGESVVMRLLDQASGLMDLAQLGMGEEMTEKMRSLIRRPHGIVLVTGPTGSGKTTTLYSALKELNTSDKKIITVEDPVEYRLPRINQVQVQEKIELSFARVLRTALRQDPDVVMIGEMRDLETAQIGLRAAITGHLVLSTLHTNSAVGTVSRLFDMQAPGYLLASSLSAVIAQRLVRKICPDCQHTVETTVAQKNWLSSVMGPLTVPDEIHVGRGCNQCGDTGFRGRVGVYELLEINADMIAALRAEDLQAFSEAVSQQNDFRTLTENGIDLILQGVTTVEEIMRISGDVEMDAAR